MRCNKCQAEFDDELKECPECGAPIAEDEENIPESVIEPEELSPVAEGNTQATELIEVNEPKAEIPMINPLLAKTDAIVKSKFFLTICILETVATAILLFGLLAPLQAFPIIMTVALWLIFANSRKKLPGTTYISMLSGTVYAVKIITYVFAFISALFGIVCFFKTKYVVDYCINKLYDGEVNDLVNELLALGGWVIGVFFIIFAVILVLLNHFSCGKIHKFIQSCYKNIKSEKNELKNSLIVCVWLIIFAVADVILAFISLPLASPLATVSFMCHAVSSVFAFVLIKKYYSVYF